MLVVRVIVPFALGYFLSYLYRAVNAVIAPELIADLGLDAAALGLLTAAYFLSFAAFQLPLGILLDRFGPRRVESALLMFAAAGAGLFAWADGTGSLIVGRALIGFGVSACLMASFKAFVMWFPLERLALVNGLQLAAGGLGAIAATTPVEAALELTDWRGVFWALAALTALAAGVIFFAVPEGAQDDTDATLGAAWGGIRDVFTSRVFWRIAPWTMTAQASFMAIQTLWAGPWLTDVAGLDRHAAATHLFWLAASMVAGFLSWGALAERLHRWFDLRPMAVGAAGMGLFMAAEALIASEWVLSLETQWPGALAATWFVFGFCGTAGVLGFAALSQAFPKRLAGRVNTALNLVVFVFAFFAQWTAGWIIDLWPLTPAGGYARDGFQFALAGLVGLQVAGAIWYWAGRNAVR